MPSARIMYFEWLIDQVPNYRSYYIPFRRVLWFLFQKEFTYELEKDEERVYDGITLRAKFAKDSSFDVDVIISELEKHPCSVLEVMIALAKRADQQILWNPEEGDKAPIIFWDMISSMGLDAFSDNVYDEEEVDYIVSRMLRRQYEPNGEGGLFTVAVDNDDIRGIELWYQLCRYLNEHPGL